jgi:hypothetical protein
MDLKRGKDQGFDLIIDYVEFLDLHTFGAISISK